MIKGLIILEDSQIDFTLLPSGQMQVTVCDGMTGKQKTVNCATEQLAASLALAVDAAGMDDKPALQEQLYPLAQPLQDALVLDGDNDDAQALRFIP